VNEINFKVFSYTNLGIIYIGKIEENIELRTSLIITKLVYPIKIG